MEKKEVDVSFIIIEYHSLEDVLDCVDSIKEKINGVSYEVVISSNSQYDKGKREELKSTHPEINWSFNKENGGFAYGMNRGIKASRGEFVIIQNPDTTVQNEKLPDALSFLRQNEEIGILGPQIRNSLGEIQDTCRSFVTPRIVVSRFFKRKLSKKGSIPDNNMDYDKIQPVDWVIGAYMITSRKNIEEVGMLNEKYFMYVEDMEWCLKFWEKGLQVFYYPPLIINYEGDRKSTLGKGKVLPFSFNKYTRVHIKNYMAFLKDHGRKIGKLGAK